MGNLMSIVPVGHCTVFHLYVQDIHSLSNIIGLRPAILITNKELSSDSVMKITVNFLLYMLIQIYKIFDF